MDREETPFFLHALWLPVRADFDVGIAPSTPSRPPRSRHGGRLSRSARGQRCASASSRLAAGASRRSGGRIFAMPVRMAGGPRRCCCRSWSGVGVTRTPNRNQLTPGKPAEHATSRGHRYGTNCQQPQSTVRRPSNPLPCHNLPRQRRLIPFSLIRWPQALGDPRKYCPEASLPPIPTFRADRLPLGRPWPAPRAFLCSPCRLWPPPTSSTRCLCSSGGSTAMEPRLLVCLGRWACKCTGSGTCGDVCVLSVLMMLCLVKSLSLSDPHVGA